MKHTRTRLALDTRVSVMIRNAVSLAAKHGYVNVTREQIAEAAKCSPALVSAHIGTMQQVRRAIMREAIHVGAHAVVLQGLAMRDPIAVRAPLSVKQAALATVGVEYPPVVED